MRDFNRELARASAANAIASIHEVSCAKTWWPGGGNKAGTVPKGELRHGSPSGYRYHKCRCVECVEVHRRKQREYRARRRVSA